MRSTGVEASADFDQVAKTILEAYKIAHTPPQRPRLR